MEQATQDLTLTLTWDKETLGMMKRLRRYVTQIQGTLPLDNLNRPMMLVNAKKVQDEGLIKDLETLIEEPPKELLFPVSRIEGMPTIYGTPIWEKLEGEPMEYFEVFKKYRELGAITTAGPHSKSRSIYSLSKNTNCNIKQLELLRQCYHWGERVRAYDDYMEEQQAIMIERRQREIQGRHSETARQLFNTCTKYMLENTEQLTPKMALEWAELAAKLERISSGMLPDKPGTTENPTQQININNSDHNPNRTNDSHGTGVTGNQEEDKDRLTQLVNVMNKIGLFESNVEVKDMEEVQEDT